MFSIENLDKVLSYPSITVKPFDDSPPHFERNREFYVYDTKYRIEWWANCSYLFSPDGLIIPFDYVLLSNTWPHRSKMNMQFYTDGVSSPTCILKIEDYPQDNLEEIK